MSKIDKEIERLLKLKEETTSACWLSSQMRLNLERAYAIKEEQKKIVKIIEDWFNDEDTCSGKPNCCIDECDLCVNCLDKLKDLIDSK